MSISRYFIDDYNNLPIEEEDEVVEITLQYSGELVKKHISIDTMEELRKSDAGLANIFTFKGE